MSTHNIGFREEKKENIYSRLVISNSKGLSEILGDIRNSKYQSCRNQEENK